LQETSFSPYDSSSKKAAEKTSNTIGVVLMFSGIGEVLVNLISYPVLIGSILIFVISLFILIAKRKTLKKEVKVLLIVLAIITAVIIGFFVFLVFAFGSNHPPAPPVPQ